MELMDPEKEWTLITTLSFVRRMSRCVSNGGQGKCIGLRICIRHGDGKVCRKPVVTIQSISLRHVAFDLRTLHH